MTKLTKQGGHAGFSLVELVTVVTVIAILAGVAIPVLSLWLPNMRLKAAARDIASAMAQARVEAIRRGHDKDKLVALQFLDPGDYDYDKNKNDPLYRLFVYDTSQHSGKKGEVYDKDKDTLLRMESQPSRIVPTTPCRKNTNCEDVSFNSLNKSKANTLYFNARGQALMSNGAWGEGEGAVRLCIASRTQNPTNNCRRVTVYTSGRITVSDE